MAASDWEDTSFAGHGRLLDALIAAVILGLVAALAASIVSDTCFHNIAGVEVAPPESERGSWCEAIAPSPGWELRGIGAVAILGAVVALLPGPRPIRASLWAFVLIALIAIPVYMTQLEYSAFG